MFSIKYFQDNDNSQGNLLGEEILIDIEEFLLYEWKADKKIYINKKFGKSTCYRWKLLGVKDVCIQGYQRSLNIVLEKVTTENDEYLTQTLKRNKARGAGGIGTLLHKGKLVEVEFGHYSSIYKANTGKHLRSNKRYTSTVQNGEMHKRRLAIVTKVQNNMVQVVPITSQAPDIKDKACFKLEQDTLKATAYFVPEVESWALCSMLQTVAVTRILPIEVTKPYRKPREHPRNSSYRLKISKVDSINLDRALLSAVNLGHYFDFFNTNKELQKELDALKEKLQEALKYKEGCEKHELTLEDLA